VHCAVKIAAKKRTNSRPILRRFPSVHPSIYISQLDQYQQEYNITRGKNTKITQETQKAQK